MSDSSRTFCLRPESVPENYIVQKSGDRFSLQFGLSEDTPGLADHFPNNPIVPGFMQLMWLKFAASLAFQNALLVEFNAVKFSELIIPSGEISLNLLSAKKENTKTFQVLFNNSLRSTGSLIYTDRE